MAPIKTSKVTNFYAAEKINLYIYVYLMTVTKLSLIFGACVYLRQSVITAVPRCFSDFLPLFF